MDGLETVQGLTMAELGGLNINNDNYSSSNDDDDNNNNHNSNHSNNDAEFSQGSGAPMRAGGEEDAAAVTDSSVMDVENEGDGALDETVISPVHHGKCS